jgi:uncharacterized phiE125 gp8 family phage protein
MLNPAELVAANTEVVADPQMTVAALSAPVVALAAPALDVAEPITLARAKAHLKVVDPDEDDYISSLIVTAREMAEGRLNRTIVQRRRVARFPHWSHLTGGYGPYFKLPKPPVLSVDSMAYLDQDAAEVLVDPSEFYMADVPDDEVPYVRLTGRTPFAFALPSLYGRPDGVRIYYTAGYPVGAVPTPIIQWMLLAIGTMYANRENEVVGATVAPLPDNFSRYLLQPYMVYE